MNIWPEDIGIVCVFSGIAVLLGFMFGVGGVLVRWIFGLQYE